MGTQEPLVQAHAAWRGPGLSPGLQDLTAQGLQPLAAWLPLSEEGGVGRSGTKRRDNGNARPEGSQGRRVLFSLASLLPHLPLSFPLEAGAGSEHSQSSWAVADSQIQAVSPSWVPPTLPSPDHIHRGGCPVE